MSIRLYIDEDSMDRALVHALRARGVDVTTALEEGMIEREDAEQLCCHSLLEYGIGFWDDYFLEQPYVNTPGPI